MKATMSYLYGYVSNSGNFWIYPHKRYCPKTYEVQDHNSYVWSIPNSKEIESINKLLLMTLMSHLLYRNSFVAKRKHVILSKHLQVLPRLETQNRALIPKIEGPKIHSSMTAFNKPRRPCPPYLFNTVQTSVNTQLTDYLLNHHKIRDVHELCFHTTIEHNLQHTSLPSPIHTDVNRGELFPLHYKLYTFPKAQAFFPSNVHKHTSFPVLCTFSLSLSRPSVIAWLIARRSGKFQHSAKLL